MRCDAIDRINDKFISQWQDLWWHSPYAHFFNSPYWFFICLKTFRIPQYLIFICREGQEIKAILPLIYSYKYGVKILCSPGKKYLDKSTLLLKEKNLEVINFLILKILEYGNLYLAEVDKSLVDIMSRVDNKFFINFASVNPYIRILQSSFRYLPSKQKNSIQNKIKRNKENLHFKLYRNNLKNHLVTIFEIENKSYKKEKKRDIFYTKEARLLFETIIQESPSNIGIAILYFRNKPIAHMLGLFHRKTFIAYHMAYLSEYRRLTPGKILLFYLLPKLQYEAIEIFDFSRGNSMLKRQFTRQSINQYDIYYPRNKKIRFWWMTIFFSKRISALIKKKIKKLFFNKLEKV